MDSNPAVRSALDQLLDDLVAQGHLEPDVCDLATLEYAVSRHVDELDLDGPDAYVALLADDDEREELLAVVRDVQARLDDEDMVPAAAVEEVVERLEATTEELEAATHDNQAVSETLEAVDGELEAAGQELAAINQQLSEKIGDVERLTAVVDGLVEALPVAAALVDPALVVRAWNGALAQLVGVGRDDALNRVLTSIGSAFPAGSVAIALRSLVSDAPARSSVETDVRPDGQRLHVRGQALMDVDDAVVALLVTVTADAD